VNGRRLLFCSRRDVFSGNDAIPIRIDLLKGLGVHPKAADAGGPAEYVIRIEIDERLELWASPSFPDTSNDMMCLGDRHDKNPKELHGRIQA
jgi:hypothetical protein